MTLFDVYPLYDIEPVKGVGTKIYTADGTEYLDLYGGHAVISIGHSHPHYVKAVADQVAQLGFYSNSCHNGLQKRLARILGRLSGYDDYQLFLVNSGAEANENAMKVASFATGRSKVLAFKSAFHGRTMGAVAATDNPRINAPFNGSKNVEFVPFGDLEAARERLASREFAAVIVEPIQGVGGIRIASDEFLHGLRKACDESGTKLVIDEIQAGTGRTGRFFAHSHSGVRADIVTMAKGIANGFPFAAVLIAPDIKPSYGMLGTTFGGNHLGCAAAIATLEVIENERLVENAAAVGEYLMEQLSAIPALKDVRGRGLMVGFDIDGSASDLRKRLLFEHRIFTGGAGASTVRILPALSVTKADIDRLVEALKVLI